MPHEASPGHAHVSSLLSDARSAGKDTDKKNGQDTAAMLPLDADKNRRYKAVKSGDDQSRAWFS
jgi:hypothetical protein